MFRKLVILAVAAIACVSAADSKVETELLQKLVRYEAEKSAALKELAEIQKIVASMSSTKVEALSTGSNSGAKETTVGSGSGGDDYSIATPPTPTSATPSPSPETESGSAASSTTVTTAPPTTTKPASAAAINHVAPVAVAVVAAAIAIL